MASLHFTAGGAGALIKFANLVPLSRAETFQFVLPGMIWQKTWCT